MELYLSSLGYDVQMSVVNGLSSPASPPISPGIERRYECNVEEMKAILSRLSDDVSSHVEKCKSAKILWDRLKKLYGEEPCTAGSDFGSKKIYTKDECAVDKSRSVNCCNSNEEETHLFMAHATQSEMHTSKSDHVDQSQRQDVFGSDGEDDEAQVDLERELVSALDELKNVRIKFKNYKYSVHEECSQLRTFLEESNNNICILTTQIEEAKGMIETKL